jgi:hypothetical protein
VPGAALRGRHSATAVKGPAGARVLLAGGLLVFVAVHLAYAALGVRFPTRLLQYWEYADLTLLRTRLLETAFFIGQPPGFQLVLGLLLKAFGDGALVALCVVYQLAALVGFLALLWIMRGLGVSWRLALPAGALLVATPAFVLYEHQLFYMLPIATLLTLSVLAAGAAVRAPSTGRLLLCFALVVAVALVHAAALPLALLGGLYVKNAILFGAFALSTWTGMHMWDMTVGFLPAERRDALVREGRLSPVAAIPQFAPVERYPAGYFAANPWPDVAVLARAHTSNGQSNYHAWGYVAIAREYRRDAVTTVALAPATYLTAIRRAWHTYVRPASTYEGVVKERDALGRGVDVFEQVIYGRLPLPRGREVYLVLLLGLPLVVGWGGLAVRRRRAGALPLDAGARTMVALMVLDIVWVAMAVNASISTENMRFRYLTDGFCAALGALALEGWWRARRPPVLSARLD